MHLAFRFLGVLDVACTINSKTNVSKTITLKWKLAILADAITVCFFKHTTQTKDRKLVFFSCIVFFFLQDWGLTISDPPYICILHYTYIYVCVCVCVCKRAHQIQWNLGPRRMKNTNSFVSRRDLQKVNFLSTFLAGILFLKCERVIASWSILAIGNKNNIYRPG